MQSIASRGICGPTRPFAPSRGRLRQAAVVAADGAAAVAVVVARAVVRALGRLPSQRRKPVAAGPASLEPRIPKSPAVRPVVVAAVGAAAASVAIEATW